MTEMTVRPLPPLTIISIDLNWEFLPAIVPPQKKTRLSQSTIHTIDNNLDVIERFLVGDIVDKHDAHGAAVVSGGDCAESLLAGSVPNLQLDLFAIHLDGPDLKVDPYRRYERRVKGVFGESGGEMRGERNKERKNEYK